MKESILNYVKRILTSKIGWFLLVSHLVIMLYRFSPAKKLVSDLPCKMELNSPGWVYIAGDYFHFHYENFLIKIVLLLDLPAITISEGILSLFSSQNFCDYTESWILAILSLVLASFQWLLAGFVMQEIIIRLKTTK